MSENCWRIEIGAMMPHWVQDAFQDGALEPVPGHERGSDAWGREGVRVVRTDQVFRPGETIAKGDL